MSEADKLRRNFAKYLAYSYLKNPVNIADICDNSLDPTGVLLGYVREESYALQKSAQQAVAADPNSGPTKSAEETK